MAASSNDDNSSSSFHLMQSPDSVVDGMDQSVMETSIDCTSKDMETVQLALEKKLKCRADRLHLVQMNILPAVSTAPVILAQTHKLQRQKTADTLQQKLRDRLSRNDLYQRNILPDNKLHLDPSLSATQKLLQKKRMADDLNSKISNRPGALELVEGHILEPNLGKALETYLTSSDSSSSTNSSTLDLNATLVTPSPTSSLGFHLNEGNRDRQHKYSDSSSPVLSPGDSTIMDDQKSPVMLFSPQGDVPTPPPLPPVMSSKPMKMSHHCKAPMSSQTRKRQHKPKYRKLRYHEYIPPTKSGAKGGKTNSVSKSTPPTNTDSPYSLLLQQQQLFLQLQVLQQQYPNGVLVQKLPELMKNLPASLTEKAQALLKPKTAGMENNRPIVAKTHEIPEDIKVRNGNGTVTVRLDELKVSALKSACKEQNLMVSGKKVELIERLLDHSNGVLPASVLNDTGGKDRRQSFMNHSISLESSNNSPQSPEPDSLFQFPGRMPGASGQSVAMDTSSLNSPVVMGLVGQLQNCDIQQQVDKMIEKQKIDYLSANGPKTVAPRLDLSKLVAVARPQQLTEQAKQAKHSKSLPTTPQQLSPAGSTDNILHELMEQSPKPPPLLPLHPTHSSTSPDSIVYHNPPMSQTNVTQFNSQQQQQRRSGRTSLPNPPPPYPGTLHNDPLAAAGGMRFTGGYHSHLAAQQRSQSLSGPSSGKHHQQGVPNTALVAETGYTGLTGGGNEPLAAFTNDDNICLNELMEMDTDFHDLFKILEKDEQVPTSHPNHHQSMSFDHHNHAHRMPLPHQDSTQSDSVMFGVPISTHHPHTNSTTANNGLKSNTIDLMSSMESDHKLSNAGSNASFNEFGTLNLDSALLGSSPHLQGYFPNSHNAATSTATSTNHHSPFDYLHTSQSSSGLVEDMSYKPSSSTEFGSGLDVHQQLMDEGHFSGINGGLFGTSDPSFLNMNLAS